MKITKQNNIILMLVDHEELDLYNIDSFYAQAKDLSRMNGGKPVLVYSEERTTFVLVGDNIKRSQIERSLLMDLLTEEL